MNSKPFRMDVSWREWYYEPGPSPEGAQVGDHIPMREDCITTADVDAVAGVLDDALPNGKYSVEGVRELAEDVLAAVLGVLATQQPV